MSRTKKPYDYYTVQDKGFYGVCVYGWGTWPRSSVLAGQPMKVFIERYESMGKAKAAYPDASGGNDFTDPQVNVNHLLGEDDPVPGGMYPDDIGDFKAGEEY